MSTMSTDKVITLAEMRKHNNLKSLWMAINDEVYDLTNFLGEHPGGVEILLDHAGDYATFDFVDMGHSADAKELMKKYVIGRLADEDKEKNTEKDTAKKPSTPGISAPSTSSWSWQLALLAAVGASTALWYFTASSPDAVAGQ